MKCGYQKWTFQTALKRSTNNPQQNRADHAQTKNRANVTLPYVKNISEGVRRLLMKHNITTCFKPAETLRRQLVNLKDKFQKRK